MGVEWSYRKNTDYPVCSLLDFHAELPGPGDVCAWNFRWAGKSGKFRASCRPHRRGRPYNQVIVEDALKEAGFETAIAPSAEEAVTLLKGKVMNYRALVTDINLKGRMNGWEAAKQARHIEPEFPIVYMTGAAAGDWASHGVPHSILLEKPFAPAQLVTAVSQLLNAASPGQS